MLVYIICKLLSTKNERLVQKLDTSPTVTGDYSGKQMNDTVTERKNRNLKKKQKISLNHNK